MTSERSTASLATNLVAGGGAGMMEALACHPLDTIKVRMQLSRRSSVPGTKGSGFLATGLGIVKKETALALYKGLGAVMTGIIPKMAIRFSSFEQYKGVFAKSGAAVSSASTFTAGLAAGVTEAVIVVTPMEVVKIRLQAQHHSMADPLDLPKYRNAGHCLLTVMREEGVRALWSGVSLTALRQGSNQAVNFTAYSYLRKKIQEYDGIENISSWKTSAIGLASGAMGPFSNAPIDTVKTRLQKGHTSSNLPQLYRIRAIMLKMWKEEGIKSFYKGITPRVMRVAPGQAVTFTVYEYLRRWMESVKSVPDVKYEE